MTKKPVSMKYVPAEDIVCKICGEGTASNSFKGLVHKYGPTTHKFKPVIRRAKQ